MKHYWSEIDKDIWVLTGPSRRLRKLYRELATLDAAIEAARQRVYVTDHAPTDFMVRREHLAPLLDERWQLIARIDKVQNGD